jgi:FSR family fosmidomycin resistance protein-like MFS transporter
VLFRYLARPGVPVTDVITWIVVYDMLAFALQAPLGALADRQSGHRRLAGLGLLGLGLALLAGPLTPRACAALAGIGNALFHVGAGAHVLQSSGRRAREIGLFIGPGSIGLAAGIALARNGRGAGSDLVLPLVLAALAVAWTLPRRGRSSIGAPAVAAATGASRTAFACGLLLLTVLVRSLAGDTLVHGWRERSATLVLALALAACAGKMLGGVVADRLGWVSTAAGGLVLAAPLAAAGLHDPASAVAGMLLLQSTTPLTVKALHLLLPQRAGLSFGLASVALLLGAFPGLLSVWLLGSAPLVAGAIAASGVALVGGLALAAGASGLAAAAEA